MEKGAGFVRNEQFPLLKVDVGGGDSRTTPVPIPSVGITNVRKSSFFKRWPEFVSICWMAVILIVIGFLAYVFSSSFSIKWLKRHHLSKVHCIPPRPPTEVFVHQIIKPSSQASATKYTEFLAMMAENYPNLKFQVFFLIDDSLPSMARPSFKSKFFANLMPYRLMGTKSNSMFDVLLEQNLKQSLKSSYNVHVNVVSLGNFMANTPLNYKWQSLSPMYLSFYIRAFSVWQNGGIALDLDRFYNLHSMKLPDKIELVMKQFNNDNSCKIDDEYNDLSSVFTDVLSIILKDSELLFNRSLLNVDTGKDHHADEPLIRKHRNKRFVDDGVKENEIKFDSNNILEDTTNETSNEAYIKLPDYQIQTSAIEVTEEIKSTTGVTIVNETNSNTNKTTDFQIASLTLPKPTSFLFTNGGKPNLKLNKTKTNSQKVFFLYDFSIYSDGIGPNYLLNQDHFSVRTVMDNQPKPEVSSLILDSDGFFIATSLAQHQFLGELIFSTCSRIHPGHAIKSLYSNQCTGIFKRSYCNSIKILH